MANKIKEYLLTTDEFRNPKVIEGPKAIGVLITRLFLLEPGTIFRHPDMGIGLGPKYRYILESDMPKLQSRIQDQMRTYLPSEIFSLTKVNLQIKTNKYLVITIIVDDTQYVYDTEESDTPIELSDLM